MDRFSFIVQVVGILLLASGHCILNAPSKIVLRVLIDSSIPVVLDLLLSSRFFGNEAFVLAQLQASVRMSFLQVVILNLGLVHVAHSIFHLAFLGDLKLGSSLTFLESGSHIIPVLLSIAWHSNGSVDYIGFQERGSTRNAMGVLLLIFSRLSRGRAFTDHLRSLIGGINICLVRSLEIGVGPVSSCCNWGLLLVVVEFVLGLMEIGLRSGVDLGGRIQL